MTAEFGPRLRQALDRHGALCVGIDPHAQLLDGWGLNQDASGVREFGLRVVEAAAGQVAVIKPQVAFFERFGAAGFAALEEVIRAARSAGIIVLSDAKRGDIGSTMAGYATAWLEPGSPLESDAVTVTPYLGPDSLRDTIAMAVRADKGVFVLAATSNPEAGALQTAHTTDVASQDGQTVSGRVVRDLSWANAEGPLGSVGFVIGATVQLDTVGIDPEHLAYAPILAPGFGFQGASRTDLRTIFGDLAHNVLASESRSILSTGPDGIADSIRAAAATYREVRDGNA